MVNLKDMATLKKLTNGQLNAISSVVDHFNSNTIRADLTAEPGYIFIGIEDVTKQWLDNKLGPYDYCPAVLDRLDPDGKPTREGKIFAYDMMVAAM